MDRNRSSRIFHNNKHQSQPQRQRSKVHSSNLIAFRKKMSDWGDEESTAEVGTNFGDKPAYKNGHHNEAENGNNDNFGGGGGGGSGRSPNYRNDERPRGRAINGGGSGNRRGGFNGSSNGYGYGSSGGGGGGGGGSRNGNSEHNAYDEENEEWNANADNTENAIFDFIPKDFQQNTIKIFLQKIPEHIETANLLEIYAIQKYIRQAYEFHLNVVASKKQTTTKTKSTAGNKELQKQTISVHDLYIQQLLQGPAVDVGPQDNDIEAYWRELSAVDVTTAYDDPEQMSDSPETTTTIRSNITIQHLDVNYTSDSSVSLLELFNVPILPELLASTPDNIELSLRRSPMKESRDELVVIEQQKQRRSSKRISQKHQQQQQQRLQTESRTPISNLPLDSLVSRRPLSESVMKLREPLKRRVFALISSSPALQHDALRSDYAFFPLDSRFHITNDTQLQATTQTTTMTTITRNAAETVSDTISSINLARQNLSTSANQPISMLLTMPTSSISAATGTAGTVGGVQAPPAPQQSNMLDVSVDIMNILENDDDDDILLGIDENLHSTTMQQTTTRPHFTFRNLTMVNSNELTATSRDQISDLPETSTRSRELLQQQQQQQQQQQISSGSFEQQQQIVTPITRDQIVGDVTSTASARQRTHIESGVQLPSTLPSIQEENFTNVILKRSLLHQSDVTSTPFRPIERLSRVALPEVFAVTQDDHGSDSGVCATSRIDGRNVYLQATPAPEGILSSQPVVLDNELTNVTAEVPLQPIVKMRESVFDGTIMEHGSPPPLPPSVPAVVRDDYRHDWFEILRARRAGLDYLIGGRGPAARRRRRRRRRRHSAEDNEVVAPIEVSPLMGILPAILPVDDFAIPSPPPPPPRPSSLPGTTQRDDFMLEHIESISFILDNLDDWHQMLIEYKRSCLDCPSEATTILQPTYTYDPQELLDANVEHLQIKLDILQEIIRNVSFDLMKVECIKSRLQAAVAFNFLLELKSADIIHLSADGRYVALK